MIRHPRIYAATLVLVLAALFSVTAAAPESAIAAEVFARLVEERTKAGAGPLERRPELDAVAATRARDVAGRPHEERLIQDRSIDELLIEARIERFHRAAVHQDMQRGFRDPAAGFVRVWKRYTSAWQTVLSPDFDTVGLATARGDDGWLILTVVLLDERSAPDLREVEQSLLRAVNATREQNGLEPVAAHAALAQVARAHSEDMARLEYFGHKDSRGETVADRVTTHGLRYRNVAENLYRSRGMKDPIASAVRGWLDSRGHRKNMLNPDFTQTGIGAALDDRGRLYFTQVFRTP